MADKRIDQLKAAQKAAAYAGQTPKPLDTAKQDAQDGEDIYEDIHCDEEYSMNRTLRDSTSEWYKQKEALKKISDALSSKNEKEKPKQNEQNSKQSNE